MKFVVAGILFVALVPTTLGFSYAWERYCPTAAGVMVFVDGVATNAAVNRCPNHLLKISTPGNVTILVDRDNRTGYVPGAGDFHEGFGRVFSHDLNPGGVRLDNDAKIDYPARPQFNGNILSYRDFYSHKQVIVNFSGEREAAY